MSFPSFPHKFKLVRGGSYFLPDKLLKIKQLSPPKKNLTLTLIPPDLPRVTREEIWKRDWNRQRRKDKQHWSELWVKHMKPHALNAFHKVLRLKEELLFQYHPLWPLDNRALAIRNEIRRLRLMYPVDLEIYFFGDWELYNDLQDDLNYYNSLIENSESQKHLEEITSFKEHLERKLFEQRLLILHDSVPRITLGPLDIPEDVKDPRFQKPPKKKQKLSTREKLKEENDVFLESENQYLSTWLNIDNEIKDLQLSLNELYPEEPNESLFVPDHPFGDLGVACYYYDNFGNVFPKPENFKIEESKKKRKRYTIKKEK